MVGREKNGDRKERDLNNVKLCKTQSVYVGEGCERERDGGEKEKADLLKYAEERKSRGLVGSVVLVKV